MNELENHIGDSRSITDMFNNFIKNWLPDIAFGLIMSVYVAKSFMSIEKTGGSWKSILADGALIMAFTIATKYLFARKGINMGKRNSHYKLMLERYETQVTAVESKIQYLSAFCEAKNRENVITEQKRILVKYGLNYTAYCDYNDTGNGELSKKQKKGIRRANHVKVYMLSQDSLTSEERVHGRSHSLGMTVQQFLSKKGVSDILLTVLFSFIFIRYTMKFNDDFSWGNLVWNLIQVTFFVVKGAMAMLSAYSFMVDEYTSRLARKTNLLKEFGNTSERYAEGE